MGFWRDLGKLTGRTPKVAGSAALGVSKLAGKGVVVVGKAAYDHRQDLERAAWQGCTGRVYSGISPKIMRRLSQS